MKDKVTQDLAYKLMWKFDMGMETWGLW